MPLWAPLALCYRKRKIFGVTPQEEKDLYNRHAESGQGLGSPKSRFLSRHLVLGTPRPGTEVSWALRARNRKRVRKESERVSRPGEPQSPQRVRHGVRKKVRKESEAAFSDSFRTPWRTLWGLWGCPGRDTLSDSFRTFAVPGPKGPGHLCAWSGHSQT